MRQRTDETKADTQGPACIFMVKWTVRLKFSAKVSHSTMENSQGVPGHNFQSFESSIHYTYLYIKMLKPEEDSPGYCFAVNSSLWDSSIAPVVLSIV